ncbi:hypothetical protein EVAR_63250_1 [Eumeta japonica]|uniref:Uncharacterized protein n=1 Tax=Eumeta variegata TaxID=151549 RepID=A0A4C2A4M8_EUMVA|nr:hypothetical protein EVAR_63250_1 [Eumeta japonica]
MSTTVLNSLQRTLGHREGLSSTLSNPFNLNLKGCGEDPRPPRKNYNQLSSSEKLDNAAGSAHCDGRCDDGSAGDDSDLSSEPEERPARRCGRVCPHDRYNNNVRPHDDFSDDTDYGERLPRGINSLGRSAVRLHFRNS